MSRQWTENQLRAVCIRDRDVCVAAGAGSGKTGVLVERFVQIVRDSLDPGTMPRQRAGVEEILVITFTEKATKEMKERIVAELTRLGLTEQRRSVETAYISTIHGFCSRILKENPFEAGVDPEFSVLEENEAGRLLSAAVEDAVERAFADDDEEIIELVATAQDERLFGTDISDPLAPLAETVRATLGRVRGAGWRLSRLQRMFGDPARASASSQAASLLREVRTELIVLRNELRERGADIMGTLATVRQEVADRLLALEEVQLDGSWESNAAVAAGIAELAKAAQRGLRARASARSAELTLQQTLARIKAAAEGAAGLARIDAEREEQAEHLSRRFWRLLIRSWERYDVLKRTEGALDNDDLQSEAVHLLQNSPAVRERYRRRFRYMMVDEFQDTNPTQMKLLELLHDDAGNNLFVVGDVQQSIYSFRHADPGIFRKIERRFRHGEAGEYVTLAENFRSHPDILRFLNGLFTQVWQEADSPFMALQPGVQFAPQHERDAVPAVELLLARDPGRAQYFPLEADAIARRIQEMTHETRPVATGNDTRDESVRYRYRDVALLLRALTNVEHYERAFHEAGIPYYIVGGGRGYYARFEVRDILNVLTVLETPLVDVALAASLRSPLVGASADTLYRLSRFAAREDGARKSLYGALARFTKESDADESDRVRIYRFLEVVERLRRQDGRLTVARVLETLIAETDLDARLLVRPNGRRRLANVRKLLQMAYDAPSQTIGEFIRRLRDIEKLTDKEGDAPTEEEASEVVRILTIHKAKGLEFPIVFVGDMARGTVIPEKQLFTCDGRNLRLGCKVGDYKDSTYQAIASQKQAADIEESFRLLYVALTRARERLVLCGSTQAGRKRGENWADTVFPICGVLAPPDGAEIRVGPGGAPMRVARM